MFKIILINMKSYLIGLFECARKRKGYICILIVLSLLAIVLGVIAAINFGGKDLTINLSHISYIRFLKGDCGFVSMMLGMILSLAIFFSIIVICHCKTFLLPFGVMFYLYLVYSQAVIFVSIILIYGIFNCLILIMLLLIYSIVIWLVFELLLCELAELLNSYSYFKSCFSFKESRVLLWLILLCVLTLLFSLILLILKNYVILLIFE